MVVIVAEVSSITMIEFDLLFLFVQVEIVAGIIEVVVVAAVNIVAVVVVQVTVQAEIIAPIHTRKQTF